MEKLEEITKKIEAETDFEKVVTLFGEAAALVKKTVARADSARGRLLEIVRDLDTYIEKVLEGGADA